MQLDPELASELINGLCLKDYLCAINPLYQLAKISKFNMPLITYQGSAPARNLSNPRSNIERHPCSRGDPGMQPIAMQENSTAPGLSATYGVK